MAKNLVVCCDGTGNEFGEANSNVVKLYTCLREGKDPKNPETGIEQRLYYHPGVGTMGSPTQSSWLGKKATTIAGLAFGYGFKANVADAYRFLMDNYADGDRIYLFGFSRGAYTVRALAGALFMYGLLCPGNEGHLPYLWRMFATASKTAYKKPKRAGGRRIEEDQISRAFRETFSRVVPIHFLGVWDTVSSIGWIYDPVKLLYDGQNGAVRKARHAVSVSERRCFFQDNLLGPPLDPNHPDTEVLREHYGQGCQQDIVQAWFAGVHSDVGGSYLQEESGPATQALKWILDEAERDQLQLNKEKYEIVFGKPDPNKPVLSKLFEPPPSADTCLHESLTWKWWPLELFPHKYFDMKGKVRWRFAPWPHWREVPDRALLHPSLRRILDKQPSAPVYKPKNLDPTKIHDYEPGSVPNIRPEVEPELAGYGVYRSKAKAQHIPIAAAAAAAVAIASLAAVRLLIKR